MVRITIKTVGLKARLPPREKVRNTSRPIYNPHEQRTKPGRVNQYRELNSIFRKLLNRTIRLCVKGLLTKPFTL